MARSYRSHSAFDRPKLARMIGKSWKAKFSAARWKPCQFVNEGGVIAIARDRSVLVEAQPVEGGALRRFDCSERGTRSQSKWRAQTGPSGSDSKISRMIAADCSASRKKTRRRA